MSRFYFDVEDGDNFTRDEEGLELPGVKAAEDEAAKTLPGIISDSLPNGDRRVMMTVRDEAGHPVLRLSLTLVVERLNQSVST